MIAQDFSDAHQRAAPGQVAVLIVDDLQPIHVQKHDADGRFVRRERSNSGLRSADQPPVIGQSGQRVTHPSNELVRRGALAQQRSGQHHDVARGLAQLRQENGPSKSCLETLLATWQMTFNDATMKSE